MDRARFIEDSRRRARPGSKSPTYDTLLEAIADDVERGAAWFSRLSKAYEGRSFATDYEASALLLHRLHFAAIKAGEDSSNPAASLRKIFPTTGGGWGEDSARNVTEFLAAAPDTFWADLARRRLQTNDPARSAGWLLVACIALRTRNAPFHLVDMGTSAGLTLIGDCLAERSTLRLQDASLAQLPPGWADVPYPVLSRTGLDQSPIDISDEGRRAWLKACLGPDKPSTVARFEEASATFLRFARDPAFLKLKECKFLDMPAWITANLTPHLEEGLLAYNSQAADFLTDTEYAEFRRRMEAVLQPWGDRGFWAELELPRDKSTATHELRVNRLVQGRLESKVLGKLSSATEMTVFSGWDFVGPQGAVRPPQMTREERPKTLDPGTYRFP